MTTFATLVSDTERHLYAGDREEINLLASTITDTATTLTFTYDAGGIQPGSYIAIDLEVIYIWTINESLDSAVVQRGMVGSTPAAHTQGAMIYVNPRFSKYDIANALNIEISDLSAPPNGLFQPKQFTTTTFPVQRTYAIPAPNTDILYPLEVRYNEPGPEVLWIRMSRWEYMLLREQPTTGNGAFASGMALRIDRPMYPGRTLVVKYAAPFTPMVALTDNVAVTGLPTSAYDIPPLGAAARLMGVREAKRAFSESEVDTRRASEVPVGAATRAAQTLMAMFNQRVKTELSRLLFQYPELR